MVEMLDRTSKIIPPCRYAFWNSRHPYRVLMGAKGSGKSYPTAFWYLAHMMMYPDANTLVVRKIQKDIRGSVMSTFEKVLNETGLIQYWTISYSPMEIRYNRTGQKIVFRGLDDSKKLGGVEVTRGVLCWLWIEEAYEITSFDEFTILDMSIRGKLPPGSGLFFQTTLTFNPWSEDTWIKREFVDKNRPDVFFQSSTYKDNPICGPEMIAKYEALRISNPSAARVICDGEWGIAEGLVYNNFEKVDFDVRDILRRPGIKTTFGLDFGYAVSKNAFVAVAVDVDGRKLWVFDEMYSDHMTNVHIARTLTKMGYAKEAIIADSAEPKSIQDLRDGIHYRVRDAVIDPDTGDEMSPPEYESYYFPHIRKANKGGDSVSNGIQFLQQFKMFIHPRCANFLKEIQAYCWATDKDGKPTGSPVKQDDHLMDAIRYAMEPFRKESDGWVGAIGGESPDFGPAKDPRREYAADDETYGFDSDTWVGAIGGEYHYNGDPTNTDTLKGYLASCTKYY